MGLGWYSHCVSKVSVVIIWCQCGVSVVSVWYQCGVSTSPAVPTLREVAI
jgi:hypothetical protein